MNWSLRIQTILIHTFHHTNSIIKGRRVMVNAPQCAVSNTAGLSKLTRKTRFRRVYNMCLTENVKIQVNIIQQLWMECNELQLICYEAVAIPTNWFDVYIHVKLFSLNVNTSPISYTSKAQCQCYQQNYSSFHHSPNRRRQIWFCIPQNGECGTIDRFYRRLELWIERRLLS